MRRTHAPKRIPRRIKTVIITGIPGTGKTVLAKRLARESGFRYVDVNQLIKKKKLYDGYDRKRKAFIVDENKLRQALFSYIKSSAQDLILDSHLSHYIDRKLVDSCIVTTCNLRTLEQRLKKRGYSRAKIDENIQAEVFEICAQEAREAGYTPVIVDTTTGINRIVLQKVLRILSKK